MSDQTTRVNPTGDQVPEPKESVGIPADVTAAVAGAQVIGSPTSDKDDEWRAAARASVLIAASVGARVVLVDVSTRSFLTSPYLKGGFAADTDLYSSGEGAVGSGELEALGRHYLVEQVEEAAAVGVDVSVWLATMPGIKSLQTFLERFPDIDVLVAPPFDHPSWQERLGGDTLEGVRARIGHRPLIVAGSDGQISVDQERSN